VERIALGLYDGPSGGAALLHEGNVLAIAEEDRIARRMRVSGLPRASVQTVLHSSGIPADEIGAVIIATESATYAEGVGSARRIPLLVRVSETLPSPPPLSRLIRDSFAAARRRRVDEALRSEFGISCPVRFLDHHLAHAVGAAYSGGKPDALAITMDAGADGVWATVTSFDGGRPRRLAAEPGSASVLGFLAAVADSLGIPEGLDRFSRLEELAVRGVSLHYEQFAPHVRTEDGRIHVSDTVLGGGGTLAKVRTSARKEDVAASALTLAGEVVRRWCTHWYVRSDHECLALGGDLFEIPAMVRAVIEAPEIGDTRVAPAPGDVGLPVAAAFAACMPGFLPDPQPLPSGEVRSPYLGISYTDGTIEEILRQERIEFRHRPDLEHDVARVLAEGRTVARFDGKTELGNDGLGNRVVLRGPEGPLRRGRIGFVLVPGAYHALVTEESFESLFDSGLPRNALRNQAIPVRPTDDFAARYPELIGWGGRVRAQVVSADTNPRLHRILREYATWSGVELLAAAPFRLPNEPLVSSPRDALRTFRLLGADYAAIGRYLVRGEHETAGLPAPVVSEDV
jgi:carbamoyltransferase